MSRKSRLAVYRDRLEAISECPNDIFKSFEPSDRDFEIIARAEAGDVLAIEGLADCLYDIYGEENELNEALFYFLKSGLKRRSSKCAMLMIKCIDKYNTHFDYLEDAISTVLDTEPINELIDRARVKSIIASPSAESNFRELSLLLDKSNTPHKDEVELYLQCKSLEYTGAYDEENVRILSEKLGMENLISLPTFTGRADAENISTDRCPENDIELLKRQLSLFDTTEWQSFWAGVMYEYAILFNDGDLSLLAPHILAAVSSRPHYREKELHELVLKKYIFDKGLGYSKEECEELERQCRFNGLSVDAPKDDLIRNAVYPSDALRGVDSCPKCDGEILHERNRYTLTMTLTNHKKRAASHRWDAVICIRTEDDTAPLIHNVPIAERRAEISRNGITLDKEKKAAQVLCRGEIRIGDKVSPIELDLILDISYVSTTKCTHCSIKVERFKRQGKYLVMQTDISIYAE